MAMQSRRIVCVVSVVIGPWIEAVLAVAQRLRLTPSPNAAALLYLSFSVSAPMLHLLFVLFLSFKIDIIRIYRGHTNKKYNAMKKKKKKVKKKFKMNME